MTNDTKRVAIWGLGKHAINNIIPAIANSTYLELYGCHSRNQQIVKDCSIKWGCSSWDTTEDMLMDSNLDIIYLSTPPGLHYEQGMRVLQSDKHLWCEKPITLDFEQTKELVHCSEKRSLSLCEGLMYLYHPQFIRLKEYLDNKTLGKIKTIHCRFGAHWILSSATPGFRFNKKLGGSSLFDVGCYPLSIILALFPDEEINILDSEITKTDSDSVDLDGSVNLKIGSQINCFLEWAYNRAYRNDIDIWGEEGSLYADNIFSKKTNYKPQFLLRDLYGNQTKEVIESSNHFEKMLEHFFHSLNDKTKTDEERKRVINLSKLLEKIKFADSKKQ